MSNWIPLRRIRIAVGIAALCAVGAVVLSHWSPAAWLLLIPALAAGGAAGVMLRVRWQLSDTGGGWQRRIHDAVVARLALPGTAAPDLLDIGCGDASLLLALLRDHPAIAATGIDFWGADWDYAQSACEARVAAAGHRASFRRLDAARLDFPDASFDIVVSVMCFHEVRAPGAPVAGPVVALKEALRVLRPGGAFVFVERFASTADYGDPAALEAVLGQTVDLCREPLVATLGPPWPLSGHRALGPVEILSGRKA